VRSPSRNSVRQALAATGLLLLSSCAASAPDLPVVSTGKPALAEFLPEDRALSCGEIAEHRAEIGRRRTAANDRIGANRHQNQVAGYFAAVILPPLWLATEGNHAEKDELVLLQRRQDLLIRLAAAKECRMAP